MDIIRYLTKELKTCTLLSTVQKEDDEATWLDNRSKGIGGSDIGAICGVSEYASPRIMYLKKTGQFDSTGEFSDASKERMRFGHLLEPVVANEYAVRSGKKIAYSPGTFQHINYPWALANVDRFIVDDEGIPYGVLECKTAGEFLNGDWAEGDLPLSYIYQLSWYLWVTGLKYGAFACLVGGNKFYFYEVFFDETYFMSEIFSKVDKFWNYHVQELVAPELSAATVDTEFVKTNNLGVIKGSEVVFKDDTIDQLAGSVVDAKLKIKELESIVEEASNRIKEQLGNHEFGYTTDYTIRWAPRSKSGIDSDLLKTAFPDVYNAVKKMIEYRVFTVRGG